MRGELKIGYGCNTGTLTDERERTGEHKLQPVATTPALYSTLYRSSFWLWPYEEMI